MTGKDDVIAAFRAAHPDSRIIVTGRPGARYLMSIAPTLVTFMVDGEPETKEFLDIFSQAIDAKRISGSVAVLIDLIRFTGAVDWGAVKTLHESIDWATVERLHIAYLVRDMQFAPLAKISGAIFPEAEHRVFADARSALAWLAAPG